MANEKLTYIEHDFRDGWPAGDDLYYRCDLCGDMIPSTKDGQCRCGNVYVDTGYGRAGARDVSKVRLVRKLSHG